MQSSRSKIPSKKSRPYIHDVKFLALLGAPYIYDISRLRVNFVNYVFLLLCTVCSVYSVALCSSVYCLCVNVYCITVSGCQCNCS
jgi:hypothetical protein